MQLSTIVILAVTSCTTLVSAAPADPAQQVMMLSREAVDVTGNGEKVAAGAGESRKGAEGAGKTSESDEASSEATEGEGEAGKDVGMAAQGDKSSSKSGEPAKGGEGDKADRKTKSGGEKEANETTAEGKKGAEEAKGEAKGKDEDEGGEETSGTLPIYSVQTSMASTVAMVVAGLFVLFA